MSLYFHYFVIILNSELQYLIVTLSLRLSFIKLINYYVGWLQWNVIIRSDCRNLFIDLLHTLTKLSHPNLLFASSSFLGAVRLERLKNLSCWGPFKGLRVLSLFDAIIAVDVIGVRVDWLYTSKPLNTFPKILVSMQMT